MNVDSYFAIGKTHVVCQDYARSGITSNGRLYAIASDGCSCSPDSDFGARFLTLTAIRGLNIFGDTLANHGDWIIWRAQESVRLLSPQCLDATLLTLHERDDGLIQANAWGDGLIFGVTQDGQIWAWEIDMGGVPGYLSYLLDRARFKKLVKEGYGKRTVRCWVNGVLKNTEESEFCMTRDKSFAYAGDVFSCVFNSTLFKFVGVCTDGALSFRNRDTLDSVPFQEVLKHMTDIRVAAGKFVERSSGFFLTKTCPKLNWQHTDDYGVAMFHTGVIL